jgi:hypothetical protein
MAKREDDPKWWQMTLFIIAWVVFTIVVTANRHAPCLRADYHGDVEKSICYWDPDN